MAAANGKQKRDADPSSETERVRTIQDKEAPRYDRQISFFERTLFGGGREWVCSQAEGQVLELAAGTARNLPYYPRWGTDHCGRAQPRDAGDRPQAG